MSVLWAHMGAMGCIVLNLEKIHGTCMFLCVFMYLFTENMYFPCNVSSQCMMYWYLHTGGSWLPLAWLWQQLRCCSATTPVFSSSTFSNGTTCATAATILRTSHPATKHSGFCGWRCQMSSFPSCLPSWEHWLGWGCFFLAI